MMALSGTDPDGCKPIFLRSSITPDDSITALPSNFPGVLGILMKSFFTVYKFRLLKAASISPHEPDQARFFYLP